MREQIAEEAFRRRIAIYGVDSLPKDMRSYALRRYGGAALEIVPSKVSSQPAISPDNSVASFASFGPRGIFDKVLRLVRIRG